MKLNKFLVAGLAGLCCFATACSDDDGDEPCYELEISSLYNKINTAVNVEIDDTGKGCETITDNLSKVLEDASSKDISLDSLKDDINSGDTACKIKKGAQLALQIVTVKSTAETMNAKKDQCVAILSALVAAGNSEAGTTLTNLQTSFTTVDGWTNMLTTAAAGTTSHE